MVSTVIQCFSSKLPTTTPPHVLLVSVPAYFSVEVPPKGRLYAGVDNLLRQDESVFILVAVAVGLLCAGHCLQLTGLAGQAGLDWPAAPQPTSC